MRKSSIFSIEARTKFSSVIANVHRELEAPTWWCSTGYALQFAYCPRVTYFAVQILRCGGAILILEAKTKISDPGKLIYLRTVAGQTEKKKRKKDQLLIMTSSTTKYLAPRVPLDCLRVHGILY
jgi:hypothetical protein